jgi:hypothetical protein
MFCNAYHISNCYIDMLLLVVSHDCTVVLVRIFVLSLWPTCCLFTSVCAVLSALFIFGYVVVPSLFVFIYAVDVGVLCKFRVVCQRPCLVE